MFTTSISNACILYNSLVGGADMADDKFKMDNLKEIREKKNLTQVRVSIDIEVSQELISQYERGISLPTIPNLIKLSQFFSCSTDYLLGLTNNPEKIDMLDKKGLENQDIIEKYNSLSAENKKNMVSYLEYLCNKNK